MTVGRDGLAYRVLTTRSIVWFAVGLVVIGAGMATLLLWAYGGGTDADKARLEAIKTAGTIVIGTGGAAALWLAARKQQSAEFALQQKEIDQAHQERVAIQSEHDAAERRVTELYAKSVEQLGSDKAPVRLGGMYALERLAQNVPEQRQTIVNVLCAYLRMPYLPPVPPVSVDLDQRPASVVDSSMIDLRAEVAGGSTVDQVENERREQERQVRLTAQRVLAEHLRPGDDPMCVANTFWSNIDLDLTDATLLNLEMHRCHIRSARFRGARFVGAAGFTDTRFFEYAGFADVLFDERAIFNGVWFGGTAGFAGATFSGSADFDGAQFPDVIFFRGARFVENFKFADARVRLSDNEELVRFLPDGCAVSEPVSSYEEQLPGHDGRWGRVVVLDDVESEPA